MHSQFQIHSTHIVLPSGSQLALDCTQSFTPNREFWQIWNANKQEVKRAGISVKRERFGWRGYVRDDTQGFSHGFHTDQHQLWTEKARDLAEGDTVLPVMTDQAGLHQNIKPPCHHTGAFEVVAKVCRNETFQLRLRCDTCDRQTPAAIKWEHFNSDVVIRAIARALQTESVTEPPLFEELRGVDSWV